MSIQTLLHSPLMMIIFGYIAALAIVLVAVCKLLIHWKSRAVRQALNAERNAERWHRLEERIQASSAKEKRYRVYFALQAVSDKWEACYRLLTPVPLQGELETALSLWSWLSAIYRGLKLLGTQNEDMRVEHEDVEMYDELVEDMEARIRLLKQQRAEKIEKMKKALFDLEEKLDDLLCALYGTTREEREWRAPDGTIFALPFPELPGQRQQYLAEYQVLNRAVIRLHVLLNEERLTWSDIQWHQQWVEELWTRFWSDKRQGDHQQRHLQQSLEELRQLYEEIGKRFYMAKFNDSYRHLYGMLFVVEQLSEEKGVPTDECLQWCEALQKQLMALIVSFERGVQQRGHRIWIDSLRDCPALDALLTSCESVS
jgi:hypothetical protein